MFTSTAIEDKEDGDLSDIASDTQFDDVAASYGVTAGAKIKLYKFEDIEDSDLTPTLFLDLKVRYMFGSEASYLTEGDLTRGANDEILYNKSTSEVEYISYHIGFSVQL